MIRPAVAGDRDRAITLMRDYHLASGIADGTGPGGFVLPFDVSYVDKLFQNHIRLPNTICLASEIDGKVQGLLLAVAFEHIFGPVRLSKDTLWWIDKGHRGGFMAVRMLDAYEAWSASQGCAFAGMAGMGDDPNIDALLKRRGYAVAEKHYLKKVS